MVLHHHYFAGSIDFASKIGRHNSNEQNADAFL